MALRSPARVPNVRPVLPRRLLPASSSCPLVPLGVLVSPVIRPLRASRVRRTRPFGSSPVGCIVCVGSPPSLLCPSDREWPHFYSPRICLVPGVPRALHVCQLARCACAPRLPVRARCLPPPFRVSCTWCVRVSLYVCSVHVHSAFFPLLLHGGPVCFFFSSGVRLSCLARCPPLFSRRLARCIRLRCTRPCRVARAQLLRVPCNIFCGLLRAICGPFCIICLMFFLLFLRFLFAVVLHSCRATVGVAVTSSLGVRLQLSTCIGIRMYESLARMRRP